MTDNRIFYPKVNECLSKKPSMHPINSLRRNIIKFSIRLTPFFNCSSLLSPKQQCEANIILSASKSHCAMALLCVHKQPCGGKYEKGRD